MNVPYQLGAYVFVVDDLEASLDALVDIAREVVAAAGVTPARVWATQPRGKMPDRSFCWAKYEAFVRDGISRSVSLWSGQTHRGLFNLAASLRRLQAVPDPPARLSLEIGVGGDGGVAEEPAARAAELLLRRAAERLAVVQGGAHPYTHPHDAAFEATLTGVDSDKQPPRIRERWDEEWKRKRHFRERPRRIYWRTLLGPSLAAKVGGAAAARAAGADEVEEVGGSLLFGAGGAPSQALDDDWRARTHELRRWLWSHSIQHPHDAVD